MLTVNCQLTRHAFVDLWLFFGGSLTSLFITPVQFLFLGRSLKKSVKIGQVVKVDRASEVLTCQTVFYIH